VLGQVNCRLTLSRDVSPLYSGALPNPRIAGINHLFQLEIREHSFRQVRACADDS
jgi:hypothetical protein